MSFFSSPILPAEVDALIKTEENKVSSFIKLHEKLIVIVLCLAAGIYCYQKAAGIIERHDQRVADTTHATLQAQVDTVKAQAANDAQAALQYKQLATQLAQSNAALAAAIASRNDQTVKQQTTDRQLPPSDLAARWATLVKAPASDIQVTATGFTVTQPAATETVVALDSISGLQANLTDETSIATNLKLQLGKSDDLNSGLNKQIDGLNLEITDQVKACTADKNLLVAKARKSKLKYFVAGFIAGIATRAWFKF